ncbi:MAG TPA: biopolymer transporter ExbD [Phycisphaerales bacterium]|nr:biopolymer transporter ExbD [Phycisphaerales bacterium]
MRRRRRGGFRRRLSAVEQRDLHYGPNMTPMVDVVMVILVFFMASTAVLGPEWMLKSALPVKTASAAQTVSDELVQIEVTLKMVEGRPVVDGEGIASADLVQLAAKLKDEAARSGPANVALLATCSGDVPYEVIVKLHELCHDLGISKIGLLEAK